MTKNNKLLNLFIFLSLNILLLLNVDANDVGVPLSSLKEITFMKNRKTKGSDPRDQLSCRDDFNQQLCPDYQLTSLTCTNTDNKFQCDESTFPFTISFDITNVKCQQVEIGSDPIVIADSCYCVYSLKKNWVFVIGYYVLIIVGSFLAISCILTAGFMFYFRNRKNRIAPDTA